MTDTSINLGPGKILDSYNIPAADWQIANKRVSIILDPTREPALQQRLKALPNYSELVAISQTWKKTTFDGLVTFAARLAQFAQTDVQSYLTVLKMIIDALAGGDPSMKTRLDNTVEGFTADTRQFSMQAAQLTDQLKDFDIQMSQADMPGGDPKDPIWNAFSLNAGLAFDILNGRFQTITDDLTGLQTDVDQKIKKDLPIVVQLVDLPVAKQRWQTIGDEAAGFVANAPAQRRYLDGDWP